MKEIRAIRERSGGVVNREGEKERERQRQKKARQTSGGIFS